MSCGPRLQRRSLGKETSTKAAGADDSVNVVVGDACHTFKLYSLQRSALYAAATTQNLMKRATSYKEYFENN